MTADHEKTSNKVLAIIPARGGSKGLPRKNLLDLDGVPLIGWAVKAASEATLVDKVIVTTDDEEIAEVAQEWGAEVPFIRPKDLANDSVGVGSAIEHAERILESRGEKFNICLSLYPTSPFRGPALVDHVVRLLLTESFAVHAVSVDYFNPALWRGEYHDQWRRISSRQFGQVYTILGVIYGKAKFPDNYEKGELLQSLEIENDYIRGGDRRFCKSRSFLRILNPAMLVDVDTPEHLQTAREFARKGLIPWHPLKPHAEAEGEYWLSQSDEEGSPRAGGYEDGVKTVFCAASSSGKAQSLQISSLVSPSDLREKLNQHQSLNGAAVRLSPFPETFRTAVIDRPTAFLDSNRKFPMNWRRVMHFVFRKMYSVGPDKADSSNAERLVEVLEYDETNLIQSALAIEITEFDVRIQVCTVPKEGDEIRVLGFDRRYLGVDRSPAYVFDGEKWVYGHRSPISLTKANVFLECGDTWLRWQHHGNIVLGGVYLLRPGVGPKGAVEQPEPIEIDDFIEYDSEKYRAKNLLTGEHITARQRLPEIFEWSLRAYLPSEVEGESDWSIELD